jgi:hypothetical protein
MSVFNTGWLSNREGPEIVQPVKGRPTQPCWRQGKFAERKTAVKLALKFDLKALREGTSAARHRLSTCTVVYYNQQKPTVPELLRQLEWSTSHTLLRSFINL